MHQVSFWPWSKSTLLTQYPHEIVLRCLCALESLTLAVGKYLQFCMLEDNPEVMVHTIFLHIRPQAAHAVYYYYVVDNKSRHYLTC